MDENDDYVAVPRVQLEALADTMRQLLPAVRGLNARDMSAELVERLDFWSQARGGAE